MKLIGTKSQQLLLFNILKDQKKKKYQYIQELEQDDHISLSKSIQTNNKLYIKKIKIYFKLAIRFNLYSQYHILIIYRYASYILTKFIKFTKVNKIICFYLLSQLIYLLQFLNINIFVTLK